MSNQLYDPATDADADELRSMIETQLDADADELRSMIETHRGHLAFYADLLGLGHDAELRSAAA